LLQPKKLMLSDDDMETDTPSENGWCLFNHKSFFARSCCSKMLVPFFISYVRREAVINLCQLQQQ
jgi:hypothetical protein